MSNETPYEQEPFQRPPCELLGQLPGRLNEQ